MTIELFKKIQNAINQLIGTVLVVMMAIILLQTFTRYVIFYSLPWSEELSRYLFLLVIMFGINIGISQGLMVRIDMIDNFLSRHMLKKLSFARDLTCLISTCFFLYSTLDMIAIGRYQVSPAMRIPMSYLYIMMFIGFLLMIISMLLGIIERNFCSLIKEEEVRNK